MEAENHSHICFRRNSVDASTSSRVSTLEDRLGELQLTQVAWAGQVRWKSPPDGLTTAEAETAIQQYLQQQWADCNSAEWEVSLRHLQLRLLVLHARAMREEDSDNDADDSKPLPTERRARNEAPKPVESSLCCRLAEEVVVGSQAIAMPQRQVISDEALQCISLSFLVQLRWQQTPVVTEQQKTSLTVASDGEPLRRLSSLPVDSSIVRSASSVPLLRSVDPAIRRAVAARHRSEARGELRVSYLDRTGEDYRVLTQEERHRGESLIVSIAALVEQLALVEETQGMVRDDRQEARRLLQCFQQDGDLVKLYQLHDDLEDRLEKAKIRHGKPLLYLQ